MAQAAFLAKKQQSTQQTVPPAVPLPGIEQQSTDLPAQMSNLTRRMRILEERYVNLRKKSQVTDQNMLAMNKNISRELRTLADDLNELQKEFADLKEKMRLIVKELKGCAKTEEVQLLQKYVQLLDPLKFATLKDVERIVEEKLAERKV